MCSEGRTKECPGHQVEDMKRFTRFQSWGACSQEQAWTYHYLCRACWSWEGLQASLSYQIIIIVILHTQAYIVLSVVDIGTWVRFKEWIRAVDCSGKNVRHEECWWLLPLRPLRHNTRPRALLFILCSRDNTCLGLVGGDMAVPPALYPWHTYCVLATFFVLLLPPTWGWGELLTVYGTLFPGEWKY